MKATGIIRRIDDLGRVAIPRDIRRNLRINYGDAFEIYINESNGVVFQKCNIDPMESGLQAAVESAQYNREELPERVRKAIEDAAKIYSEFKKESDYQPDVW